ncbi:MAG: VanZ family protein [Bacteroidales bacterium]|nr:VanZ family protein [Bacteroidales bacterium]
MRIPKFLKKGSATGTLIFNLLLFGYVATVGILCFANLNSLPDIERFIFGIPTDKIVHFCMFFPFPILAFFAYDKQTDTILRAVGAAIVIWATGGIFAGLTETIQGLLPYRSEDMTDFMADLIAITLSSIIVLTVDILQIIRKK